MKDFNALDTDHAAPLPQTKLYHDVLQVMGREVWQISLTYGKAQCIVRHAGPLGVVALLPKGPIWASSVTGAQRRQDIHGLWPQLKQMGVQCLITNAASFEDAQIFKQIGHIPIISGQCEARINLLLSPLRRRQQMQGKWRNRLARAEGEGLRLAHRPFDYVRDQWLLEAELKQRKLRHYRSHPIAFSSVAAALDQDHTRLFLAFHKKTLIAAMLFLRHGASATYFLGHSNDKGRSMSAHNLLLWEASNWLASHGHRRLDLGIIDTETGAGLARFKLGSGAQAVPLGDTILYTRPTAFVASMLRKITPHREARAVGVQSDPSCH